MILLIYCLNLSTILTHESNMFFYHQRNGKPQTDKWASNPPKLPLTHERSGPHLTHGRFLGPTPLIPPQTADRSLQAFSHSNAINIPFVTMGHPISTGKLVLFVRAIHFYLHCISLDPPDPPPQMVSKSARLIFHNSPDRQTDGQTDSRQTQTVRYTTISIGRLRSSNVA